VRPGEKLHEVLVSEEEVHHCVKRGAYYAIRPMLPELRGGKERETNALSREYSSGDNVLNLAETVRLLKRTRLMLENQDPAASGELLR
jgi:FlaA1/EpsC-like NDP-sugar epimerase